MVSVFRGLFWTLFLALVVGAVIAALLPWNFLLEDELKRQLEARGFSQVELTVSDLDIDRIEFKDIAFKAAELPVAIDVLQINGAPELRGRRFEGQWQVRGLATTFGDMSFPKMDGNGTLAVRQDQVAVRGRLQDAPNKNRLAFDLVYSLDDPKKSLLTVAEVVFPWGGGILSAQNVKVPLVDKPSYNIRLTVSRVSAEALLRELIGNRAGASGSISGTLPVTITPAGDIVFRQGSLASDGAGVITVSPDVIPGDNPQVALVREVLTNFHYTSLSLQINSGKGNKVELGLRIEGKNPDVQQGREVKMNVNLTGDVLDLVRQNLLWLTNPKKIMELHKNANP